MRKPGDRKDGRLIRELDSLHFITGIIYPNRCDNEGYISECINLENTEKYVEKRNSENPEYHYNVFQIVVAAIIKTITLRPKMNRFIVNGNFYQRNEVSASFVVKKLFSDNGSEALAFIHAKDEDTLDTIHDEIYRQVSFCKKEEGKDQSTDSMDFFNRLPRLIAKWLVHIIMLLDKLGIVPQSLIDTDPYYSSCVISNLGSIKLHSGYHHLTNWGTCSAIILLGEKKKRPFFSDDGTFEMKMSIDLGLTIDERLADGYYYAKTVRLLKYLIENPEELEKPISQEVDF